MVGAWAGPTSTASLLHSELANYPEIWISDVFPSSQLLYQMVGFVSWCNRTLAEATEDLPRNFTYSLIPFGKATIHEMLLFQLQTPLASICVQMTLLLRGPLMLQQWLPAYFGYVREHPSLEQWHRKQYVLFNRSLCYKQYLPRQSGKRISLGLDTRLAMFATCCLSLVR